MTNPPLSPSRIDLYLSCPAAYKHYTIGTTPRPTTSFQVGSCCHHALETFVDSLDRKNNTFGMNIEEAMDYAISYVEPFRPNIIKDSIVILKNWLKYDPLPNPKNITATEMRFGPPGSNVRGRPIHEKVKFTSGLNIHGIIDLIWEDKDVVIVGDYKTSREYFASNELSNKIQAQLYATAIRNIIPNRPIRIEFYMLRYPENGPIVWEPQEDEYKDMEKQLLTYQKRIYSDKDMEATPGDGCKWCEYNYTCKAFKLWASDTNTNGKLWHTMSLLQLLNELDIWFAKYISIKRMVDELKSLTQSHMERENLNEAGNWKITRKAYANYHEDVQPLIAEYGGITKCPKELRMELENWKKTNWGKPFLKKVSGW